jgi:hypothetical protein
MSAKDLAQSKKLESQAARVDKAIARNTEQQTELAPTIFEGHDPNTGTSKIRKIGGEPVIGGDRITHGTPQEGDLVLSRPTQGKTRVDKRSPRHTSIDCGGTGAPNPRLRGTGVPGGQGDDPLINDAIDNPPAEIPTGRFNERCVGFALVYEEYTGAVDEAGNFTTQTVTVPNSPQCTSKVKPFSPLSPNDDGCVKPGRPKKSCQWFDITEDQAQNFQGCPVGTTFTGFVEYPEGSFRAMCCTLDNSEPDNEGIGVDWRPENVLERGAAIANTTYCSTAYTGEIAWNSGNVVSQDPGLSYSLTSPGSGIQVDWGGGGIDYITGTSWTVTKPTYPYNTLKALRLFLFNGNSSVSGLEQSFFSKPSNIEHSRIIYPGNEVKFAILFQYIFISPSSNILQGQLFGWGWSNSSRIGEPGWVLIHDTATTGDSLILSNNYYLSIDYIELLYANFSVFLTEPATWLDSDTDPNPITGQMLSPLESRRLYWSHEFTDQMYKATTTPGTGISTVVTSNTGDISERSGDLSPTITLGNSSYQLNIADNTGIIFTQEYETEPTDFSYVCRSNTRLC